MVSETRHHVLVSTVLDNHQYGAVRHARMCLNSCYQLARQGEARNPYPHPRSFTSDNVWQTLWVTITWHSNLRPESQPGWSPSLVAKGTCLVSSFTILCAKRSAVGRQVPPSFYPMLQFEPAHSKLTVHPCQARQGSTTSNSGGTSFRHSPASRASCQPPCIGRKGYSHDPKPHCWDHIDEIRTRWPTTLCKHFNKVSGRLDFHSRSD
jgi:hypothetical protein